MTEQEVQDLIEQFIVTNGVNAITANVLRPILIAILAQTNDYIGTLGNLQTVNKDNLVDAINEVIGYISAINNDGVKLYQGNESPLVTPPASFNTADFYYEIIEQALWQFNGIEWVRVIGTSEMTNVPYKNKLIYAGSNTFALPADVIALDVRFNGQGDNINWSQLGNLINYGGAMTTGDFLIVIGIRTNVPLWDGETFYQNNVPMRINILSTDLVTNDIAGFVAYFNALSPSFFVLETTSLVQFYCTDTKDIYQITGKGKGIYGAGGTITSANVLHYGGSSSLNTYETVISASLSDIGASGWNDNVDVKFKTYINSLGLSKAKEQSYRFQLTPDFGLDMEADAWQFSDEAGFKSYLESNGLSSVVITDFDLTAGRLRSNFTFSETVLGFNFNGITKINKVDALVNLTELYSSDNNISVIENLDALVNLTNLYLSDNNISVIENLDALVNLNVLYLNNNNISVINNLDTLVNLTELYLYNNNITTAEFNKLNSWAILAPSGGVIYTANNTDNFNTSITYATLLAKSWTIYND